MADGRHFENRYIAISQRKSSDFDEILYTAADFELDERHVIKNEKVALDRLRVRQNIFLVRLWENNCSIIIINHYQSFRIIIIIDSIIIIITVDLYSAFL